MKCPHYWNCLLPMMNLFPVVVQLHNFLTLANSALSGIIYPYSWCVFSMNILTLRYTVISTRISNVYSPCIPADYTSTRILDAWSPCTRWVLDVQWHSNLVCIYMRASNLSVGYWTPLIKYRKLSLPNHSCNTATHIKLFISFHVLKSTSEQFNPDRSRNK